MHALTNKALMWQDKDAKGLMRGTGQIYNNLSSQAAQRSYSLLMLC